MTNYSKIDDNFNDDDTIDINKVIKFSWKGKWWVLLSVILSLIFATNSIKNLPELYTSKTIFGFNESSRNIYPREISTIGNILGLNEQSSDLVLTQINGTIF